MSKLVQGLSITDGCTITSLDQDDFKDLTVEEADLQCSPRSSKRIKVGSKENGKPACFDQSEPCSNIWSEEIQTTSHDAAESYFGLRDDESLEVIVIKLGAFKLRDPTKPMPAPTRYVRK
jgi:hypothetical protein